jgi:hypothetical protein
MAYARRMQEFYEFLADYTMLTIFFIFHPASYLNTVDSYWRAGDWARYSGIDGLRGHHFY